MASIYSTKLFFCYHTTHYGYKGATKTYRPPLLTSIKMLYARVCRVECAVNGNPKPELKEMTGAFIVKFIRRTASEGKGGGISEGINGGTSEGVNGGANEGINRLLGFISKNPGKRVVEIAAALNIPSKTIERWIKKLREQGRIIFTGPRKTGGYNAS